MILSKIRNGTLSVTATIELKNQLQEKLHKALATQLPNYEGERVVVDAEITIKVVKSDKR